MDDIVSTVESVFSPEATPEFDARPAPPADVCLAPGEPAETDRLPADCQADPNAPQPAEILEALLFAADAPLSAARLAELIGECTARDVREQIDALNARYESLRMSFRVEAVAGGYQMLTLAAFRPWLARLNRQRLETRLSPAAMETLSIIAYKQPIIRADVESIRGVASGEVVNRLREMGLVKIVGRAEIVGRPMMYGTTRKFLDVFGLASLDELPAMETLKLRPARPAPETAPEAEPARAAGA